MNMNRILQNLCTLAASLLLLTACTQDKLSDPSQGEPLPEGVYPIEFTATGLQATPQSRATADGTWSGGENIAIKVYGDVKQYVTESSGSTTALKPAAANNKFYWQRTDDIIVSAWYPANDDNMPSTWSVQEYQREGGYQKSDFLYANDNFSFQASNALHFYHQTAKVVINIRNEGILTDANNIAKVVIGSGRIALTGSYQAPTGSDHVGTWSSTTNINTITPIKLATPNTNVDFGSGSSTETALASYQALVIPQTVEAGSRFIYIVVNGTHYYYKAENGKNELKAGYVHTYNITVKGSSLSVTTSESIGWGSGDAGSGSVTFIGNKFAKDAEIGDFYMSDGTLVDSEATFLTPEQKAACRGIVYCVDNSFITSNSTHKSAGDYTHGLAVALKDAGSYTWYNRNYAVSSYSALSTSSLPANSSSWYVPNIEELKYICRGSNYGTQSTDGKDMLNIQFGKLGSANASAFVFDDYWSSTPDSEFAFRVAFYNGFVWVDDQWNGHIVRCAFAF